MTALTAVAGGLNMDSPREALVGTLCRFALPPGYHEKSYAGEQTSGYLLSVTSFLINYSRWTSVGRGTAAHGVNKFRCWLCSADNAEYSSAPRAARRCVRLWPSPWSILEPCSLCPATSFVDSWFSVFNYWRNDRQGTGKRPIHGSDNSDLARNSKNIEEIGGCI